MTDRSSSHKPSLFNRLRAMPGFTVAVVAFFLTIVMGAGGTYAYALWNQTAKTAINVATGQPTPFIVSCDDSAGDGATLSWTADGADRYSFTITSSADNEVISGEGNQVLLDPGGGGLLSLGGSTTYTVTANAHYGGSWISTDVQRASYTAPFLGLGESMDCIE